MARGHGRERGFALLIVMWSLALLALLTAQVTGPARSEARIAANLRAAAVAQAAADGAVHEAVLRVLQGAWNPRDGIVRQVRIGAAVVALRLEDESGKINPNASPRPVLAGLIRAVGVDAPTASVLAARIMDWRSPISASLAGGGPKAAPYQAAGLDYGPPGRPFACLQELRLVAGMTPDLYARIAPFLSVYQEGTVNQDVAAPAASAALDDARLSQTTEPPPGLHSENRLIRVRAEAVVPGGARAGRAAVVRLLAAPEPGTLPFHILTWDNEPG
jgi:general secretion pathway protein K